MKDSSYNIKTTGRMFIIPAAIRAFACLIIGASSVMANYIIEISSNHSVEGQEILLRDIVHNLSGLPEQWAERSIMKSPSPGEPKAYSITSIAFALQQYPDMQDVILRGEPHLMISRAGSSLAMDKIKAAIESYASQHDDWKNTKVIADCDTPQGNLNIPAGDIQIEVTDHMPQQQFGRFLFNARVVTPEGEQYLEIYANVTPMQEIWVAKHQLNREHILNADNLMTQTVPGELTAGYIPASENIEGLEINRAVQAGQPLSRHFLIQPMCAQNGDLIHVRANRGNLSVILKAKALSTGRKNERILCMNERSKRRLMVRLTGTREATLDF